MSRVRDAGSVGVTRLFGQVVLAHRKRLGLTQEELADKTGLSVRGIRDLEAGRVRVPRQISVRRLAEAFDLQGAERDRFQRQAVGEAAAGDAVAGQATSGPAQLPMEPYGFAGRVAQLERLDHLLSDDGGPSAVVITAIAGTAGVGKTALAVRWAHRVRDRFPDGQLYANLRGFDPSASPMAPTEALQGFLGGLGVSARRIPAGLEEQAALYRSLLANRRMLILLDNARDAEQVRPLLPGAPGCRVLVTSRNQLTSLVAAEGAHPLPVDLLSVDEARELLVNRLGRQQVEANPAAADSVIAHCARLPLALAVVAARGATQPPVSLEVLAKQLGTARGTLQAFASDDPNTDVRAVFSWSYRQLRPAAARLFRLLGLHVGPDIGLAAAASLAGLPADAVRPALAELARAHLVAESEVGRFAFHDLLRAYAAEQAYLVETDDQWRAAVDRVLDHYARTAQAAAGVLDPRVDPLVASAPRPGVAPESFAGHDAALRWFAAEHRVLLAAVGEACRTGRNADAWQLAYAMTHFLDRGGLWHDQLAVQRLALGAAQRSADAVGQAHLQWSIGGACLRLGRLAEAHGHLRRSLDLFEALGDRAGRARAHQTLGATLERQGRRWEAARESAKAHALYHP